MKPHLIFALLPNREVAPDNDKLKFVGLHLGSLYLPIQPPSTTSTCP